MLKKLMQNCRKPQGVIGRMIVGSMNYGHSNISRWGLSRLTAAKDARVLDIGCGGGANIKRLLAICPQGFIDGIDYSEQSVAVSRKKNLADLGKRCEIRQGTVSRLPYDSDVFDAVTAFETIYFWPDVAADFREVRRVLKPGGSFLICNSASDPADGTWPEKIEGMRIYGKDELARLLSDSGLSVTVSDTNEKGWLCLVCRKDLTDS
jgi:ubiquinone/menaquinone biosynthesis C-methylase UbiE